MKRMHLFRPGVLAVAFGLSAGCGSNDGKNGAPGASGNAGASGAAGAPQPRNPLSPSVNAKLYVFPEPGDAATCRGAKNETAVLEKVSFAQTHVMEPGWPFFYLVSERPALVEAIVTGSGTAPDVLVQAFLGTQKLGELCLKGPATLPASVAAVPRKKTDRFTATLPSAWLRPGLSITIQAGTSTRSYSSNQLGVVNVPDVNLILLPMDILNYNAGAPENLPPATFLGDFASAVPVSHVRFGTFPGRAVLPRLVTSHSTSDGSGVPPIVMDRRRCEGNETPGTQCMKTDADGMDILGSALRVVSAIHEAAGEFSYAFYFGNSGQLGSGGWGGGKNFIGADFTDVFIHEQGHSFSLPHWGEGPYQDTNPGPGDYRYPYGGFTLDGGGRGDTWNYAQNIGEYLSNVCQEPGNSAYGKERSDAMQRNHACIEWRSGGAGTWDGYGDFSAYSILRNMRGGSAASGTVPYRGADAPYHLPQMDGYPNLVVDATGKRSLVRETGTPMLEEKWDFLMPQSWDTPVATIFGSYHPGYPEANILYAPIEYRGTLPRVIDPTDAATFAYLGTDPYEGYFYWPKDLTVKVTYVDGTSQVALVTQQGPDRNWTLGQGCWRSDMTYFAVNVPAPKKITKVELYKRPFCVRHGTSTEAGNIVNPSLGITAANFMNGATLAATWQP